MGGLGKMGSLSMAQSEKPSFGLMSLAEHGQGQEQGYKTTLDLVPIEDLKSGVASNTLPVMNMVVHAH